MARSLTTDQRVATKADHVIACYLVQIDLPSGSLRFADAGHDIDAMGQTWRGAGGVGRIEPIEEGIELQSRGIRMTLSGVSPAVVSAALSEPMTGPVNLWVALYDRDTQKLIDAPIPDWSGELDAMQVVTEARKKQ